VSELQGLNRRARCIAATIHDTIGPDVIYAVAEGTEEAFQFAGEHADGVIYISEFTRDQFGRRFVRRPDLVEGVVYSSLNPAEYVTGPAVMPGEWILIFGNAYDHKDLERTTRIVSAAFPYEKIRLIGSKELGGLNVEAFDSGALENAVVEGLFQRAKCVVFPSFYEGFGLPLLKGLAYRKAVIARRARVFREIVARFPHSGRLIEFDNSLELVPAIGKVLHGNDKAPSPHSRGAVNETPYDWKSCAAHILQFAEQMQTSENVEVWRERDRALRYVASKIGSRGF
jgi:glycosyltransferase involved in cell wall biosynthesis